MKTLSMLLSGALILSLVAPVAGQADEVRTEILGDLDRTISEVQAELATIDVRQASDDWMVFESQDHGLIEVDLGGIGEWVPAVRVLRDSPASEQAASDTVATRFPDLWEASVLLADAPDWVLDAGPDTITAWLRDRFGHLQTPERKAALYDAERALLLEELAALRRSHEFFQKETPQAETPQTEDPAQTERAQVEEFCREIAIGETLLSGDGSVTYLGEPIPPIEELPDWCRDALLARLTGSEEPIATPPRTHEVVAQDPIQHEDDIGFESLPDIRHGRWDGVWEYWGAPTLTLQQVGEHVYGTYQNGDGWMKLAIVNDRALEGRWYEKEHAESCDETRDGTAHWGTVVMSFDPEFQSYWGDFGMCDSLGTWIEGKRAR